jgi:hypothetical protein
MESVVFDGKEYVKASVLAQKFRYTQDYLGQLCRGRKVDARLVGRAWYINLESLEKHRAGKYKPPVQPAGETVKKASSNYLSRIDVEPVLKNKTVKVFKQKHGVMTELPVRYEKDEYSLIPRVNKQAVSVNLPILPAEAETLKIKKEAKHFSITDFKPEALPEVYLSGSVRIESLAEALKSTEEDIQESSDITNKIKPERVSDEKRVVSIRPPKRRLPPGAQVDMRPIRKPVLKVPVVVTRVHSQDEVPVVVTKKQNPVLSPQTVPVKSLPVVEVKSVSREEKRDKVTFSPDAVRAKQALVVEHAGVPALVILSGVFVCALAISVTLLAVQSEVVVSRDSSSSNFVFDTANLSLVASLFR